MSNYNDLLSEFNSVNSSLQKLLEARSKTLEKLRSICPHPKVIETGYLDSEYFSDLPARLCLSCGIKEKSWNWYPGHPADLIFKTSKDVEKVDRETFNEMYKSFLI